MKLLNVRLGPADARMAADLRKNGVPISRVVRDAIRAAYEQHAAVRTGHRRASEIMADIYREHPDPPDLSRGTRDRRDRRSVRRAIRERLRRRS
jgi:hypothetical protein